MFIVTAFKVEFDTFFFFFTPEGSTKESKAPWFTGKKVSM